MQHKVTPQEMFDAFKHAVAQSTPEGQALYAHVAENWEQLSEEERRRFQEMSWKFNVVMGEFTVE